MEYCLDLFRKHGLSLGHRVFFRTTIITRDDFYGESKKETQPNAAEKRKLKSLIYQSEICWPDMRSITAPCFGVLSIMQSN